MNKPLLAVLLAIAGVSGALAAGIETEDLGGGGGGGGSGDVTGPGSSTDNAVARFDGTGGKTLQNSAVIVDDSGNITGVGTLATGTQTVTGNIGGATDITATGTVQADILEADTIRNEAGTGAPTFSEGLVLANTKDITLATDGGSDIGASAAEVGTLWVQTIDDSDGTVTVDAILHATGNITTDGTVDGRDLATDGTKLDGIESGATADQAGSEFIQGGAQEMDGDQIDIDYTPTAYTPSTDPAEASSVDHLTAHLDGIDNALGGKASTSADDGVWSVDWDMGSLYGAAEASGLPAGLDGPAGIASHPTTAPIKVAAFDDTADEGRHRSVYVETSTATVRVRLDSYAQTCSSCSTGARMCVAFMPLSNATWQTAQCFDVDAPGNTTSPVQDTVSASVATWGIQAGERHLVLLYRDGDGTSGTDDLTDDLYVVGARVEGEP